MKSLLLLSVLIINQPVPIQKLPPLVNFIDKLPPEIKIYSFADGYTKAKKENKNLILFLGNIKPKLNLENNNTIISYDLNYESHDGNIYSNAIFVIRKGSKIGQWFHRDSTTAAVLDYLNSEKVVQLSATPFSPKEQQLIVDDNSPWYSSLETEEIKTKFNLPITIKFYNLAPRYQALSTTNNGRTQIRTIDPLHDETHPFLVSGGMANIASSKWRSLKALAIPLGKKISVWEEDVDVRAFSIVKRWRWRFPVGTIAYDILINKDIFEIRTQTKVESSWQTNIIQRNKLAAPEGYNGAGDTCASCHSQTGVVVPVPGKIYLRVRWGDDGRFSWRPFDDNDKIDKRWPIEMINNQN